MWCGVHAQSPVWRVGQSGGAEEVLSVVTVLVVTCVVSGLVSAAVGYWLAPGGAGGLRAAVRRLNEHDDDLAALEERISRREKKAASEKGVAARTAQEEIAELVAKGAHLQRSAEAPSSAPTSRAEILGRVKRRRPTTTSSSEEIATDT